MVRVRFCFRVGLELGTGFMVRVMVSVIVSVRVRFRVWFKF